MKKLAKKSAKPTIADMTPKQFEAALARYGMELTQDGKHAEGVEVVSVYGFELTGKTRRAKLAQAIAAKEAYDESAEESNDSVIDPQTGLEIHEADYGDDRYQIADTAIGRQIIAGEDVTAEIEAAEDGTGPAKAKALREAAEANTTYPLDPLPVHVPTNVVDGMSAPIPPAPMQPLKAFTSTAVAELFASIETRSGQEAAAKILQNAVRDCGKKTVVDGKLGPYTLKLANKIDEVGLLKALSARSAEAK